MVKVKGTSGCGQGAMEGGRQGRALGANVRFLASIQRWEPLERFELCNDRLSHFKRILDLRMFHGKTMWRLGNQFGGSGTKPGGDDEGSAKVEAEGMGRDV